MLLAIDCGNTNVVFAVYDGERQVGSWRGESDVRRTADDYAVWLTQLMTLQGLTPGDVSGAIIANVVPQAQHHLVTLCRKYFRCEPLVVGEPSVELGIEIDMERPDQVGEDRLVNAVAAYDRYGGSLVIVDFGTATTFDIVGEQGAYEGGVIAPGINLSIEALAMAAAKLPRISVRRTQSVIGRSTVPAMEAGIFWGYIGLIEGLLDRIQKEIERPVTVVATGGLAPLFADATTRLQHVDPDMTLRGLRLLYEKNKNRAGEGRHGA